MNDRPDQTKQQQKEMIRQSSEWTIMISQYIFYETYLAGQLFPLSRVRDEIVDNTGSWLSGIELKLEMIGSPVHLPILLVQNIDHDVKDVIDFVSKISIHAGGEIS